MQPTPPCRASRAPRAASEVTAQPARGCFATSVAVVVAVDSEVVAVVGVAVAVVVVVVAEVEVEEPVEFDA